MNIHKPHGIRHKNSRIFWMKNCLNIYAHFPWKTIKLRTLESAQFNGPIPKFNQLFLGQLPTLSQNIEIYWEHLVILCGQTKMSWSKTFISRHNKSWMLARCEKNNINRKTNVFELTFKNPPPSQKQEEEEEYLQRKNKKYKTKIKTWQQLLTTPLTLE